MDTDITIGVIGGSGIYQMDALTQSEQVRVDTPFGPPSDLFMVGRIHGQQVAFLPRHGTDHHLLPSELNFKANIYALKTLGVTHILSVTAVGSLQEKIAPLDIVIPDQLVDRTTQRDSTFFGDGIAAHIPFAEPFCPDLSALLHDTAASVHDRVHKGGTFVTIEGPAFSTRAESSLYRQWGIDIIGMTTLQEAKLSREAEICYCAMAMVTDYDCWKEDGKEVNVAAVIANLNKNSDLAKKIICDVIPRIRKSRPCLCADSLHNAIMTRPDAIGKETRKKLGPIISRYLD